MDGKVAPITGGSSGIGLATDRRFNAEGARVVITGRCGRRRDCPAALGEAVAVAHFSRLDVTDIHR